MRIWELFWTVSLLGAGVSFAFITLIVMVKGGKDLREMIGHLSQQQKVDRG